MIGTKEIQAFILNHWLTKFHAKYICSNFTGAFFDEADVLVVNSNLYVTEFEIKVTRSDFFNDFKKERKHNKLKGEYKDLEIYKQWKGIPNKFFYAVPKGLVNAEEVPEYAGLIYLNSYALATHPGKKFVDYSIVKKAPFIHKERADEHLIAAIARVLSYRLVLGCSIMRYNQKQNEELV